MLCGSSIQPKTVESSNYWHFGGNKLLLLTKNALVKRCQKIWAGSSPPSLGQNPKEQQFFLRRPPLRICSCSMRIRPWYLFFCLCKIIHKPRTMLRLGVHFNHALIIHDYYSSFRGFYLLVDTVNCSEISTNICLFVDSVLFIAHHRPKCVCLFVHSRLFSNLFQCCGLTSPPLTLFHQTTSNQFLHQTAQNESKSILASNRSN